MEQELIVCEACRKPFEVGQWFVFKSKRPIPVEALNSFNAPCLSFTDNKETASRYMEFISVIHGHCG